jgi:hypothetical protein
MRFRLQGMFQQLWNVACSGVKDYVEKDIASGKVSAARNAS